MTTNNTILQELEDYYRSVKKSLSCSDEEKSRILATLESNVSEYLAEHPNAEIVDIVGHFGEPELFQREYISSLDDQEVAHKISKVKTFRKWLIVVGIAILAVISVVCIWIAVDNSTHVARQEYNTISGDGIIAN